ncbi:hypothetical protein CWATWH0402_1542 [Crocosphaera watsonii WH 0402]|uniref:Uncharacterized protein n=3 Tax=Crocosphaera watsonii TaxID=263511 RepID=T2JL86_CROWT|nr:hypothetical protein CWATWH0003_B292 [Crocosphaera watsonii WH 0003]CCQ55037.1 hypothetical protein CWATWH0005_4323 [Crocosphaera watsonii WH 0005]CCQ66030.1 hypothetical protein CWATWH0402_1542 [Crocosphaera watsonii WH 0402]
MRESVSEIERVFKANTEGEINKTELSKARENFSMIVLIE